MKKLLSTVLISLALGACTSYENTAAITADASLTTPSSNSPKNIIMVVGDGMGPAYTTAYRYFNDNPETKIIEETVFDRHLVGMASTYPARVSGYVTDSAAAATALATGVKSYNGAIGVDVDKNPVETVLEWAKKQGKKTGVVVTSQINHATPASYLAHNESRRNYNAIADSYIDDGIKADLYFGGGWQYYIRDDRNIVDEFKSAGFHYLDDFQGLSKLPANTPVLGLFGDVALPWALDDTDKLRLLTMTKAATKQLENSNGYFLLVEASQVDWAGHSNDIASAMAEMTDLAKTMLYLEQYVKNNPDTLVVLTADHSTGGFTIAANGKYEWNPEVLRTMQQSPQAIAKQLAKKDISISTASELLNFEVTQAEVDSLTQAKSNASKSLVKFNDLEKAQQQKQTKPNVDTIIYLAVKKLIDQRTNSGWTSGGHTAIDVPVFAFGKRSEMFHGKIDNTDIAKKIFTLLGKE
ncbi:alkaline phosphatase [Colwellia piezophila]|uniref:alkaline phosphatase n=1 Tax=Colwellia piezophila TaxID=211668 RepID=UPI00037EE23F|nr:alkaline phosphatase [Colwellia piezophila]